MNSKPPFSIFPGRDTASRLSALEAHARQTIEGLTRIESGMDRIRKGIFEHEGLVPKLNAHKAALDEMYKEIGEHRTNLDKLARDCVEVKIMQETLISALEKRGLIKRAELVPEFEAKLAQYKSGQAR